MADRTPRERSWRDKALVWLWSPFVLLPVLLISLYLYMQAEDTDPPLVDVQVHYNREA